MDEFLWASEYYCEDCESNHSVSVWMTDRGKYVVTDCDGDTVAEYQGEDFAKLEKDFPEITPPAPPKKKRVRWHILFSPCIGRVEVASAKRGGRWNDQLAWRDFGIAARDLPDNLRLILALPEDKNNNTIMEIGGWDELRAAFVNLGGTIHRNTCVGTLIVEE